MDKVFVRKSKVNGKGLFVTQPISKGQKIFQVKGEIVNLEKFFALTQVVRDNTFRLSKNFYLNPRGELGDYLNHSCQPNAKVVKKDRRLFIESIESIKQHQEVVIDYSTILAADDYWVMKCDCGTLKCRSIIKRINLLPKSVFKTYMSMELIPKYILNIRQ